MFFKDYFSTLNIFIKEEENKNLAAVRGLCEKKAAILFVSCTAALRNSHFGKRRHYECPTTFSSWLYIIHTVLLETDVRRSDFVVIFFQLTQNWTALNFEVNFRPLIQWDSRGLFSKSLMKLGDLLMTSKSERQRTSGPQKRSKVLFYVLSQIYFDTGTKP